MKKVIMFCLWAVAAQTPLMSSAVFAADQAVAAKEGSLLYSEDGRRLGSVYKVGADGSVKLIYNSKMVIIPANTLSAANGKLTTTLSKDDVYGLTLKSS
jgi:hypothetical protein